MKKIIFILMALCFSSLVYAGKISAPPPLSGEPAEEQHYLKEIYDNFHVLEITESAPNGSRNGKKGKVILYNNSGTYTLWVNTDGSTTWQQL